MKRRRHIQTIRRSARPCSKAMARMPLGAKALISPLTEIAKQLTDFEKIARPLASYSKRLTSLMGRGSKTLAFGGVQFCTSTKQAHRLLTDTKRENDLVIVAYYSCICTTTNVKAWPHTICKGRHEKLRIFFYSSEPAIIHRKQPVPLACPPPYPVPSSWCVGPQSPSRPSNGPSLVSFERSRL